MTGLEITIAISLLTLVLGTLIIVSNYTSFKRGFSSVRTLPAVSDLTHTDFIDDHKPVIAIGYARNLSDVYRTVKQRTGRKLPIIPEGNSFLVDIEPAGVSCYYKFYTKKLDWELNKPHTIEKAFYNTLSAMSYLRKKTSYEVKHQDTIGNYFIFTIDDKPVLVPIKRWSSQNDNHGPIKGKATKMTQTTPAKIRPVKGGTHHTKHNPLGVKPVKHHKRRAKGLRGLSGGLY